jgi:hypothetical protein
MNGVGVLSEVEGQMDAEQYVAILRGVVANQGFWNSRR